MVYGQLPFQHIPGGPLPKMNYIADPSHVIDYPAQATPKGLQNPEAYAVDVPPAAIDAMQRCLCYRKEQRLTIPELLVHEFLRPKVNKGGLEPGATSITEAQMGLLVNFILTQHKLPPFETDNETARVIFAISINECLVVTIGIGEESEGCGGRASTASDAGTRPKETNLRRTDKTGPVQAIIGTKCVVKVEYIYIIGYLYTPRCTSAGTTRQD